MNNPIYRCFSVKQKDFLLENGNKYELIAKDVVNDKKFWLFIKTSTLDEALTKWSQKVL